MLKALGEQFGLKVIKLGDMTIPAELTELVNETMATSFKVVPISQNKKDKSVTVAMAEPQNPATLDSLKQFLGVEVKGVIAAESDVSRRSTRLYAGQAGVDPGRRQADRERQGPLAQFSHRNENTIDLEAIEEMAEAAPVRKLLNMVLLLAIKDKASDIHFEPFEDEYKMRYRVDGVLYELVPPPRHLAPAISSPDQGHVEPRHRRASAPAGRPDRARHRRQQVDIRVSTLPTLFGESVVLRILDRTVVNLDLNKIGMPPDILVTWRRGDREAQRDHPRDRADVVGQDDHALRHA